MTVIHRDLSRLEKGTQGNLLRVSKGKCKVLQLCRRKFWCHGGQQVEDESGISPVTRKANILLDRINRRSSDNLFYFSTFEVFPRQARCIWGFQHNDKLEEVQRRDTNMTRVYKKGLRSLGLKGMEKTKRASNFCGVFVKRPGSS